MHPFRPVPAILCRVSNVTGRLIHDPHTPFFISVLFQLSWFGTFSGSRTDAEYFRNTIQSEAFRDYPIHYLYVTSGTFDFALPRQLQDNTALLSIEPRLTTGVNTDMDVFPMRYHSQGNWHLALYNLLQRIF